MMRRNSRLALVAPIVLAVALGLLAAPATASARKPVPAPATFRGPNGVEASWVIKENAKKGTSAWRITDQPRTGSIAGFANVTDATAGQRVQFYVSSSAPSYRVEAFRMGYYGGEDARLVWSSKVLAANAQPPCTVARATNTVSCADWSPSFTVKITTAFPEGDYLFKLTGSGNEQSYVPLTVWDPESHAAYFVKNDVFTWQAWNPYGGYDFYEGEGACAPGSPTYPPCNRARVVSFDRPYGYGEGAADFLAEELPLVVFAERRGLDVSYGTDVTVEQHPSVVDDHRVLLSLGHDECWSLGERVAVEDAAAARGLNVVFFGASGMLRHVRLQSSPLGPDREEVDYRDSTEDPLDGKGNPLLVTGNTWASPPASWPETSFVGGTYEGYLLPDAPHAEFVVADASAWIYHDTGLHDGSVLPGVIASDYDEYVPGTGYLGRVEVLGRSPIPGTSFDSDLTYYTATKGDSGVVDFGTNNWIPALAPCGRGPKCAATEVDRITKNVLSVLGRGPAGRYEPTNDRS